MVRRVILKKFLLKGEKRGKKPGQAITSCVTYFKSISCLYISHNICHLLPLSFPPSSPIVEKFLPHFLRRGQGNVRPPNSNFTITLRCKVSVKLLYLRRVHRKVSVKLHVKLVDPEVKAMTSVHITQFRDHVGPRWCYVGVEDGKK